jgi:UDP-N-acetylglucosamine 4,6-dehydratase/5-epimerase
MNQTILITGITGFLGRNFVKYINKHKLQYNIVGIANSERKISLFMKEINRGLDTPCHIYKLNLADEVFYREFDKILKLHNVDYVIHSAAMKHVDICEANPIEALKINTIASNSIVDLCLINKVKNLICLSTDKSNTPFNAYGMSKNLMERIVLKSGYSVYQGANFFGSDGSVIDIWFNQYCSKLSLTVTDVNHVRYFNEIEHVIEKIIENIDSMGKIILPDHVYEISLEILLESFCEKFNYNKVVHTGKRSFEKDVEDLDPTIKNIIKPNATEVAELLNRFFDKDNINISSM